MRAAPDSQIHRSRYEGFSHRHVRMGTVVRLPPPSPWKFRKTDCNKKRYAFDVIGKLFFSNPFGFLQNAHDHAGYIHALDLLIPLIAVACTAPTYVRPLVLVSGAAIPRVFKALKALKHIESASLACVVQREHVIAQGKAEECEDMLQSFFDIMREKGQEKDFGITEVKMEAYGAL